jgi:signal transduction histidine kinase
MDTTSNENASLDQIGEITRIIVILAAYVSTFVITSNQGYSYTNWQIIIGLLLGAVYLYLEVRDEAYFARFPSPRGKTAYFAIQLAIVLIVQILLLSGLIWLMWLPLVVQAVERLSGPWRWIVAAVPFAGYLLAIGMNTGEWTDVPLNLLLVGPAVLFVAVFTELRANERKARRDAETLVDKLESANHQLAAYAVQAEELAATHERNRMAREIHDNLGHYLTIINVQLEAARHVIDDDSDRALEAINTAQRLTKEGLTEIRRSVTSLRDSPVTGRPLPEAIATLADETRRAGIVTEFVVKGDRRHLETNTKMTLYRTVQEGLTNVRKHARASRVDLALDYTHPSEVHLSVKDNGVGTVTVDNGGFGLLGVNERVGSVSGSVELETAPGQGFTLAVAIPG